MVKNVPANAGDLGSIPGSGRSPGMGNGNPLQWVFLFGKFHEQRSLEGWSMGSQLSMHTLLCIYTSLLQMS